MGHVMNMNCRYDIRESKSGRSFRLYDRKHRSFVLNNGRIKVFRSQESAKLGIAHLERMGNEVTMTTKTYDLLTTGDRISRENGSGESEVLGKCSRGGLRYVQLETPYGVMLLSEAVVNARYVIQYAAEIAA